MTLTNLRYYAKRLGIHKTTTLSKTMLTQKLQKMLNNKKRSLPSSIHASQFSPPSIKKIKLTKENEKPNDEQEINATSDDDSDMMTEPNM